MCMNIRWACSVSFTTQGPALRDRLVMEQQVQLGFTTRQSLESGLVSFRAASTDADEEMRLMPWLERTAQTQTHRAAARWTQRRAG